MEADAQDVLYVRGRLFYRLPPTQGQSYGKSLLAFQMLRRLNPQHSSNDFWLGRIYELQGNSVKAGEFFERALTRTPVDSRALLYFKNETERVVSG